MVATERLPIPSLDWPPLSNPHNDRLVSAHNSLVSSPGHNFQTGTSPVPTRINLENWDKLLAEDTDRELSLHLRYGFPLNYTKPELPAVRPTNHQSAVRYPNAVDSYIIKELTAGTLLGPFTSNPLQSPVIISPLQTVPKKNATGPSSRRVVLDLSYPGDTSVNAGIPRDTYLGEKTELHLPSVDRLISMIHEKGPGPVLLFKLDLSRCYRQVLFMCPKDYGLCAFQWRGLLFIDIANPFGVRSACFNCQRIANAVTRLYKRLYNREVCAYIDDYGGCEIANDADRAYIDLYRLLSETLGLELALDKCVPPTTCMTFLGFEIDTTAMVIRIPMDKLQSARTEITLWFHRSHASRRQLQSLLGRLIHISGAVLPGRRFVARLIDLTKSRSYPIALDAAFYLDIQWWHTFMTDYNGVSLIQDSKYSEPDTVLQTDSCRNGMGAFTSAGFYLHSEFPDFIADRNLHISALELLCIVVACRLWGHMFSRRRLVVRCDNEAVCMAVNHNRSRDSFLQAALRELWFIEASCNFTLRCVHIPGLNNRIADALSRYHSPSSRHKFECLTEGMSLKETQVHVNDFQFVLG